MVTVLHRLGRLLAVVALLAFLCQCTTRTVKSTRSSFSFAGDGDRDELRKKFAERGYTIEEDGTIKADKPDLFSDTKARGLDGGYQTKTAKFRKTAANTKEFPTPEYIQRQEFRGARDARESGTLARESDSQRSRDRQAGKLFRSRSDEATELASYETGADRDAGRIFGTGEDRRGSQSFRSAPIADGIEQQSGYRENAALTMDDVKKMVSPAVYARAMEAEN